MYTNDRLEPFIQMRKKASELLKWRVQSIFYNSREGDEPLVKIRFYSKYIHFCLVAANANARFRHYTPI